MNASAIPKAAADWARGLFGTALSVREVIPLALLVLTSVGFYLSSPVFLSSANISNMLALIPELGIIAIGMTLLLISGEFDLSVGAVFGFAPLMAFTMINEAAFPIGLAVLVGLAIAAVIGVTNGAFVTKVGISSFLVTLAMLLVVRGLGLYISEGFPQQTLARDSMLWSVLAGRVDVGPYAVPAGMFWFLGIAAAAHFLLNHTAYGNKIMATGGNANAARARGIKTDRVKITLFALVAVLSFLAGLISAIRIASSYPIAGTGFELEVIAMSVVGGTLLFGGKGTIVGTVFGVLLLRSIRNGIIIVGVPGLAYTMFVGLIILLAVSIQAVVEKSKLGSG